MTAAERAWTLRALYADMAAMAAGLTFYPETAFVRSFPVALRKRPVPPTPGPKPWLGYMFGLCSASAALRAPAYPSRG